MFRRQLAALEFPSPADVDIDDPQQFASIVHWLEDQKIRFYPIEQRAGLRQTDCSNWKSEAFALYRNDIGIPGALQTDREQLAWLLNHAVRLEYLDGADGFAGATAASIEAQRRAEAVPKDRLTDTFDDLFAREPQALAEGIRRVSERLQIGAHCDPLERLQAVASLAREKLGPAVRNKRAPIGQAFAIKDGPKCAFDDADVDQAAKILRLLQIHHVRTLQTQINETIVAVQELTADPKTNAQLGKVGY